MSETKVETDPVVEKPVKEKDKPPRKRSYYYDDAYGYESFDPDAEEDESDKEEIED